MIEEPPFFGHETPPDDRPVRIRLTPHGVKLAFFHGTRALPPFKLTIPHEQWAQMVALIAYPPPGVERFEAYVGFTPEALALHCIDAVEAGSEIPTDEDLNPNY